MEEIEYIEHEGRVTYVDSEKGTVTVTLVEQADCGACPASKLCSNFSADKNVLTLQREDAAQYSVGEYVKVRGTERLHQKAILIATVIPTCAILIVMIGLYLLTGSQLVACLSALGAMVIFFVGLYLMRHKLAHEFSFELIKEPSGPALRTENKEKVEQS